jgi:hypothetical protein
MALYPQEAKYNLQFCLHGDIQHTGSSRDAMPARSQQKPFAGWTSGRKTILKI